MAPYANLELYHNDVTVEPGDSSYPKKVDEFRTMARLFSESLKGSPLEGLFEVWSNMSEESDFLYDLVNGCYYGSFYSEGKGSGPFLVVPFEREGEARKYLVIRSSLSRWGIMAETLEYDPATKRDTSMRNQIRHVVLERENPHVGNGVVQKKLHRVNGREESEIYSILRSNETWEAIKAEAEDPVYLVE